MSWSGFYKPVVEQRNAHVTLFRNVNALAAVNARLTKGGYPSADAYYGDRHLMHDLEAAIAGKKPHEHNPARFWYDNQSN